MICARHCCIIFTPQALSSLVSVFRKSERSSKYFYFVSICCWGASIDLVKKQFPKSHFPSDFGESRKLTFHRGAIFWLSSLKFQDHLERTKEKIKENEMKPFSNKMKNVIVGEECPRA